VCGVSHTGLDFGTVAIDSFVDLTFSLTNVGSGLLMGFVSETCDHFSIVSGGGPYSLDTDQSLTVTVRFEPAAEDTHTCEIDTGAACANVACTGIGGESNAIQPVTWGRIKSEFLR
jgi:hypothetical protein